MLAIGSLSAPGASHRRSLALTLVLALTLSASLLYAQDSPASGPRKSQPGVLEFRSDLRPGMILALPDTDRVRLSDGRMLKVGDVRRLSAVAKRLRAPGSNPLPAALARKPAGKGVPLRSGADLAAALERSDDETVQLPSGRLLTVGMLRLLQPEIEGRIGRSLSATRDTTATTGKAVRVGAKTDWAKILGLPDDTPLEAPDGTRITVADLKQALANTPARTEPAQSREGG
ncbi:MAG: hypothetical protein GY937_00950 [bacterium]|nr:hypothetical protein [bacterium]